MFGMGRNNNRRNNGNNAVMLSLVSLGVGAAAYS